MALPQGFTPDYAYPEEYVRKAMGTLRTEVAINGRLYPFNGIDQTLLHLADDLFLARLTDGMTAAA